MRRSGTLSIPATLTVWTEVAQVWMTSQIKIFSRTELSNNQSIILNSIIKVWCTEGYDSLWCSTCCMHDDVHMMIHYWAGIPCTADLSALLWCMNDSQCEWFLILVVGWASSISLRQHQLPQHHCDTTQVDEKHVFPAQINVYLLFNCCFPLIWRQDFCKMILFSCQSTQTRKSTIAAPATGKYDDVIIICEKVHTFCITSIFQHPFSSSCQIAGKLVSCAHSQKNSAGDYY